MKKLTLISLAAIFCILISGMAQAATFGDVTGATAASTVLGGGSYKPSAKVAVTIVALGNAYSAASVHSGAINLDAGKGFATQGSSPQIWVCDKPTLAVPTVADQNSQGSAGCAGAWY